MAAEKIKKQILDRAWCGPMNSFAATYDGNELDASLLQMAYLRFLPTANRQLIDTIHAVRNGLSNDGWLYRYRLDDGFGSPKVAFTICTFWLVEALAEAGCVDDAKRLMDKVHGALTPLGLIAEDYDTASLRMWGNFPQAYSHVGLIHAAFAASPSWTDVL